MIETASIPITVQTFKILRLSIFSVQKASGPWTRRRSDILNSSQFSEIMGRGYSINIYFPFANRQKKPILVWSPGGKHVAPDWLFWMIPHKFIFGDIYQIRGYLRHVDEGTEDDKRWVIFPNEVPRDG